MNPVEALKKLSSMINTVENMTLKKEISELYTSFQELNKKCNELRDKNLDLKEEISVLKDSNKILEQELEKELRRKESVFFNDGAYWTKEGEGPYCQVCYDTKKLLIITSKDTYKKQMKCPVCGHKYVTEDQRKQTIKSLDTLF